MSAPALPAFDPESPDAEILGAFETVRACRAFVYGFDGLQRSDPEAYRAAEKEIDSRDADEEAAEKVIYDTAARTPSGAAVRLILNSTAEFPRWLDHALAECGILAVYHNRKGLDGRDVTAIEIAHDLLTMEFEQALSDWERQTTLYRQANALMGLADGYFFDLEKRGQATDETREIRLAASAMEDALSDAPQLNRLMRALATNWEGYRRKAEIMLAEGYSDQAGPWLLRDVNFLTSAIDAPASEAEAA